MRQFDHLRILCLLSAAVIGVPTVAEAAPTISSLEILTPTVNVDRPASSPRVKLATSGDGTIIQFTWQGPSGEFVYQTYQMPNGFGPTTTVQGYLPQQIDGGGYETEFSPYSEAGTWTMVGSAICDAEINCSYYSASQFPPQTFKIVNSGRQDISGPGFLGGTIETPTVSLSHDPILRILVHANDDVSGVASISVCLTPPTVGVAQLCAVIAPPVSPILNGNFLATVTLPTTLTVGVYTIQNVYLRDVAQNSRNISNPGQIYAEFGGASTVTVKP